MEGGSMTEDEVKARYTAFEMHDYIDIGGDIGGTFWWCRKCGAVEHNDNEFGNKYLPSRGSCEQGTT